MARTDNGRTRSQTKEGFRIQKVGSKGKKFARGTIYFKKELKEIIISYRSFSG
jgi:hypothetical protein